MPRPYRGARAYKHKTKPLPALPPCPDCRQTDWALDLCLSGCCPPAAICKNCGCRIVQVA